MKLAEEKKSLFQKFQVWYKVCVQILVLKGVKN